MCTITVMLATYNVACRHYHHHHHHRYTVLLVRVYSVETLHQNGHKMHMY